ncbi:zinc-binding dehydrogenase, partial [Ferrimicrobium sp.]|uniref:zinc-binding dehydrogenase n=1 Tax=Ferrimicrobium sp. TaxID=2926050 RepID=UPI002606221E
IQGASIAGAAQIVAVDPVPFKLEQAKIFGATHFASSIDDALPLVQEITWGKLANVAIITTGVATGDLLAPTLSLVGKMGKVVVTAISPWLQSDVQLSLLDLTLYQKEIRGSIFGSANPRYDIPRLLKWYMDGRLKLDELITRTYVLDEINQGYQDMRDGRNIRGMITFD